MRGFSCLPSSLLLSLDPLFLFSTFSFSLSLLTDWVVPARQHASHNAGPDLLRLRQLGLGIVVEDFSRPRPGPLGETFLVFVLVFVV